MAVPRKLVAVPNSATRELWRIAESGEMDELATVLPQADINARNEHGMTALMRAASHGSVPMVRALLEHGADSNVKRNDNFTALSLAAFFGHAEIVEILMRHGANADVATRSGTSPQMWAKARSFGDVAKCLEKTRQSKQSVSSVSPIQSAPPPPAPPPPAPVVVHTLKEPPEIWDLVQEAPRNFNPRSAFMARVGSMKRGFVLSVAALVVLGGVIAGSVVRFKGAEPTPPAPAGEAVAPVAAAPSVVAPVAAPPAIQSPEETSKVVAEIPLVVSETPNAAVTTNVPRRSRRLATSRAISNDVITPPENVEVTAAPPVVATPQFESKGRSVSETKKPPAPVNSPVISPPKASQPKAKVIQWP